MKTEEKGSKTHLQKAGQQMKTFPLSFPCSLSPLQEKKDSQREMRSGRMTLFQFCHTPLQSFPSVLFQNSQCCCHCHFTGIFSFFKFTREIVANDLCVASVPYSNILMITVFEFFSQLFLISFSPTTKMHFAFLIAYKKKQT